MRPKVSLLIAKINKRIGLLKNAINILAKATKYNKELVPLLEPSTDYAELIEMKASFENVLSNLSFNR
jgi:hypothetical protein